MKRLLRLALSATLMFSCWPAQAADLFKNIKVSGGLDLQAIAARNAGDFQTHAGPGIGANDRLDQTLTRLWLSGGWDLLDDVHARVTLRKNDRSWGTAGGTGQGAGTDQPIGAGGVQANTFVSEANFKIDKVFGRFDLTAGRLYYGDPGDLILYFGPRNDYGLSVTNIDAFRVDAAGDWVTFSGLAGHAAGNAIGAIPPAAATNDQDVHGFNLGVKNLPVKTNVFLWNQITHGNGALGLPPSNAAASGVNDNLWVYGAKFKGQAMGGWAALTVAANAGTNRALAASGASTTNSSNYDGRAFLFDAGYKADVNGVGGFVPWFNYAIGTGRSSLFSNQNEGFTSIASDYRPGAMYGRFDGNVFSLGGATPATGGIPAAAGGGVGQAGLNNRVIWGLGLKTTPAALTKLTGSIAWWDYRFQRATASIAGSGPAASGNKHIGSEFDFQLDWKHSDNVLFDAGVADFQPGGFIKEAKQQGNTTGASAGSAKSGNGVNPAYMVIGDVNVRF